MTVYILSLNDLSPYGDSARVAAERFEDARSRGNAKDLAAALLMHAGLGLNSIDTVSLDAAGASTETAPFFCVSCGGSYAAAVVSDYGYIGIDIADIRPRDIRDEHLHAEEHEWLGERSNRDQSYAALLTAKESLRKAADAGLEPASYSILPISQGWHIAAQGSWYLHWKRIDGHILCVCSMKPETLELRILGPNDIAA